ncbi:MAG: hypothetical protein H0W36_10825 [Gemmatimonadetes bacterium]|nr:hypothetical protein [Gemmatimonadota bacterium]
MRQESIRTAGAPAAIGPYSQGIEAGGWVFTAGQLGADPADGMLKPTIEAQTLQALENIGAILEATGCGWGDVVKTTVYLKDLRDFATFNAAYARVVREPLPARSTIQAAGLPKDALVEIDAIACKGGR